MLAVNEALDLAPIQYGTDALFEAALHFSSYLNYSSISTQISHRFSS